MTRNPDEAYDYRLETAISFLLIALFVLAVLSGWMGHRMHRMKKDQLEELHRRAQLQIELSQVEDLNDHPKEVRQIQPDGTDCRAYINALAAGLGPEECEVWFKHKEAARAK